MTNDERNRMIAEYEERINNHPVLDMSSLVNSYKDKAYVDSKRKFIEIVWRYEVFLSQKHEEYSDVLVMTVNELLGYYDKEKDKEIKGIYDKQREKFTHFFNKCLKQRIYVEKQNETPGGVTGVSKSKHREFVRMLKNLNKLRPCNTFEDQIAMIAKQKDVSVDYVLEILNKGPVIISPEVDGRDGDVVSLWDVIEVHDQYFDEEMVSEYELWKQLMNKIDNVFLSLDERMKKDVIRGLLTREIAFYLISKYDFMPLNYQVSYESNEAKCKRNISFDCIKEQTGLYLDVSFIEQNVLCNIIEEYVVNKRQLTKNSFSQKHIAQLYGVKESSITRSWKTFTDKLSKEGINIKKERKNRECSERE